MNLETRMPTTSMQPQGFFQISYPQTCKNVTHHPFLSLKLIDVGGSISFFVVPNEIFHILPRPLGTHIVFRNENLTLSFARQTTSCNILVHTLEHGISFRSWPGSWLYSGTFGSCNLKILKLKLYYTPLKNKNLAEPATAKNKKYILDNHLVSQK